MPLITPADLSTHIYAEIINEITRNDETIATKAIDAAVQEAKLYLSRFDLVQLFGTNTVAPTINDPLLQSLLKDIAVWHLLRLSGTGVNNAVYRIAYEDALKTLKSIMEGQAIPDGWPYAAVAISNSLPDGDAITWHSNAKRSNHY